MEDVNLAGAVDSLSRLLFKRSSSRKNNRKSECGVAQPSCGDPAAAREVVVHNDVLSAAGSPAGPSKPSQMLLRLGSMGSRKKLIVLSQPQQQQQSQLPQPRQQFETSVSTNSQQQLQLPQVSGSSPRDSMQQRGSGGGGGAGGRDPPSPYPFGAVTPAGATIATLYRSRRVSGGVTDCPRRTGSDVSTSSALASVGGGSLRRGCLTNWPASPPVAQAGVSAVPGASTSSSGAAAGGAAASSSPPTTVCLKPSLRKAWSLQRRVSGGEGSGGLSSGSGGGVYFGPSSAIGGVGGNVFINLNCLAIEAGGGGGGELDVVSSPASPSFGGSLAVGSSSSRGLLPSPPLSSNNLAGTGGARGGGSGGIFITSPGGAGGGLSTASMIGANGGRTRFGGGKSCSGALQSTQLSPLPLPGSPSAPSVMMLQPPPGAATASGTAADATAAATASAIATATATAASTANPANVVNEGSSGDGADSFTADASMFSPAYGSAAAANAAAASGPEAAVPRVPADMFARRSSPAAWGGGALQPTPPGPTPTPLDGAFSSTAAEGSPPAAIPSQSLKSCWSLKSRRHGASYAGSGATETSGNSAPLPLQQFDSSGPFGCTTDFLSEVRPYREQDSDSSVAAGVAAGCTSSSPADLQRSSTWSSSGAARLPTGQSLVTMMTAPAAAAGTSVQYLASSAPPSDFPIAVIAARATVRQRPSHATSYSCRFPIEWLSGADQN